jgi:uncharacterized protein
MISTDTCNKLEAIAADAAASADPGHDILHVHRVVANAQIIGAAEGVDAEVVLPAALLHELFNYPKDHPESANSGEVCAERATDVLRDLGFGEDAIARIAYCIRVHPFSRGIVGETLEARVLQDADRLDALGAIGIARVFSTGSAMGRPFYAEHDPFCETRPPNDKAFTLDHFYRKLLKLPTTMHTATARQMAEERVGFLHVFLGQLRREIHTDARSVCRENGA